MLIKDILKVVDIDKVFLELKISLNIKNFEPLKQTIYQLKKLEEKKTNRTPDIILVSFLEDIDEYFYDVCGLYKRDSFDLKKRFAIDTIPWDELLLANLSDKSIKLYGLENCFAQFLYEITEFGFTFEQMKENVQKFEEELEKAMNIENQKTYTLEEFNKHMEEEFQIKIPVRSEKEIKEKQERMKTIWDLNFKLMSELI